MDLLEYQAKILFRAVDIPTLPSQSLADPSALKQLRIPYPVALKSQVRAGERAKAGGIKFVTNTVDAIVAARHIFNLPIRGEYPQVILAEARYDTQQEFFLAVMVDPQRQQPVLLGSSSGGTNLKPLRQHLKKVWIEETFSSFYTRRLGFQMGLTGPLLQAVSLVLEKMYRLLTAMDLELVEINPLGINRAGQPMALDGKILFHPSALIRHPDLQSFLSDDPTPPPPAAINLKLRSGEHRINSAPLPTNSAITPLPLWLTQQRTYGMVGIMANRAGLALAGQDLLMQQQAKLAGCLLVDTEPTIDTTADTFNARHPPAVLQGLSRWKNFPRLKVVLVLLEADLALTQRWQGAIAHHLDNQLGPLTPSQQQRVREYWSDPASRTLSPQGLRPVHYVLFGSRLSPLLPSQPSLPPSQAELAYPIYPVSDLEQAIAQTLQWI